MSFPAKLFLSVLAIFVFLETGLRIFKKDAAAPSLFDVQVTPTTSSQDWFPAWEADHAQLSRNFQAYEIYRLRPHNGKAIRINSDGTRFSWHSSNSAEFSIALFGGSTLWGSFARDFFTIPSHLAKNFAEEGTFVSVTNHGEIGFVLSQEIHRALRLFSEQQKYSYLVFVDGVNDSLAAISNFSHGVEKPAGLPWEYEKYEYLFKLGNTGEFGFGDILKKSKFVREVLSVGKRYNWISEHAEKKNYWRPPSSLQKEDIAKKVAENYAQVTQAANTLGRSFGAHPVFILQPLIFFKQPLTFEEQRLVKRNESWRQYILSVYENIRAQMKNTSISFLDYSQIFAKESDEMFSDVIHYSELGNKKIADRLFQDLSAIVKKSKPRILKHNS